MKRFQITAIVTAVLCLVSILISSLIIGAMSRRLLSETAHERWSGDGTAYAQLSAFVSPEAGLTREDVEYSLKDALDRALVDASIAPANESARIFALGFGAEGSGVVSRTGEYGKVIKNGTSAVISACGGDYFLFHPLEMLSGHYFSTTDILNDCVIIDNDLAWQMFGSSDVVGMSVRINGKECFVSGVCESGGDGEYSEFYGDTPRVFVPYSLAEELLGNVPVETVEVTLPSPIGGFAMKMFSENLRVDEELCEFKENSERFTDKYLRDRLLGISDRGVRTKPIAYPYFENTAVKLSDAAAGVYIFKIVPIVILVLILTVEVVILYIKRRVLISAAASAVKRIARDIRQNRRSKKQKNIIKGEDIV